MWTPLILLCYIDRLDCAIPAAPAYLTEQECQDSMAYVLEAYAPPEGAMVMGYVCYSWGQGS